MTDYAPHVINKGDTQKPLGFKLVRPNGTVADPTGLTVKCFGKKNDGTAWIAEAVGSQTGIAIHPTSTFTVDTDTDELVANDHKVEHGDQVIVATATALPSGLVASTRYFARDVTGNRFKLSLRENGAAVPISSAGTGPHTFYIVGSGTYTFQADDVATATPSGAPNWFWIVTIDGSSKRETFPIVRNPKDRGLPVEIVEAS